jgi:L-ascorbate metabolism protein UlaG (beta-lactamase superfamily)
MQKMKSIFSTFAILVALAFVISVQAQAAEPSIKWLGHAAFVLTTRTGKIILIDPWLTNPKAPRDVSFKHVDGILITHGHSDHVGESFDLAKKFNAPIIASYELTEIAKKKGVASVLPINPSGTQKLADLTVTAVEAIHSSGYQDGENMLYGGAPLGFIIQQDGGPTIYDAGDTAVFSDMSLIGELYHPQIAMLPIGGIFTMKPSEAAYAVRAIQPHVVIPMHFGTFPMLSGNPAQLKLELQKLGLSTPIHEMTIGKEELLKNVL